jgi:hypothetical protein
MKDAAILSVIAGHRVGAKRRPMTGSAKQSMPIQKERMDCFVAALLAMTLRVAIYCRRMMQFCDARSAMSFIANVHRSEDVELGGGGGVNR